MSLDGFLTDTVTLREASFTADAEGGQVKALAAGTSVAAYVRDARGDRAALQGRDGSIATHIVYFGSDPGLDNEDVIAWGSRTLVVLGRADGISAASGDPGERYWSVLAKEVN